MGRYGLLGRTLGHSWSVPIHQALGCTEYALYEVEPEDVERFLTSGTLSALNVTIPYKKTVMPFCDVIDPMAQAIGSVNTLVWRSGRLYAYNTDAAGFCYMARRAGIGFSGAKVLVLGSGGASLTAAACARSMGAGQVVVISRSGPDNYQNLDRHADADIVVNTTPVGMFPNTGEQAVDLTAFPRCRGVLDVIYNPRRTALCQQAERLGIPHSDGLPMLVHQAAAAEEHFFDRTIPPQETERILAMLRQDTMNIVLIGMPGCGKTTVGRLLAQRTGREAIDLDAEVEKRAGCTIPALFAAQGEEAFRALERQVVRETGKLSGKLLLTGGGVVKDRRNYADLHQNGRIYHLLRELDRLPTAGRPLSQGDLSRLWAEREPLYRSFRDAVIDNNGTAAATAEMIWRDFCAHSGDERT